MLNNVLLMGFKTTK